MNSVELTIFIVSVAALVCAIQIGFSLGREGE